MQWDRILIPSYNMSPWTFVLDSLVFRDTLYNYVFHRPFRYHSLKMQCFWFTCCDFITGFTCLSGLFVQFLTPSPIFASFWPKEVGKPSCCGSNFSFKISVQFCPNAPACRSMALSPVCCTVYGAHNFTFTVAILFSLDFAVVFLFPACWSLPIIHLEVLSLMS